MLPMPTCTTRTELLKYKYTYTPSLHGQINIYVLLAKGIEGALYSEVDSTPHIRQFGGEAPPPPPY